MFVLHSDCSNLWKKCLYCSESSTSNDDDQTADSRQVQPPELSIIEGFVHDSNSSSTDTAGNPTNVFNNEQQLLLLSSTTTTSSSKNTPMNPDSVEVSTDLPAEEKKQRVIIENISRSDDPSFVEEEASVVVKAVTSVISQQEGDGVVAVAEPKNDQLLNSVSTDEKMENQLKEQKDPIMGADLILLDFDISLVHNQSRVEALLLSHTFIGSAYRASSKEENVTALLDDTVVNVEYQGDNIIGCFDCNGNHAFELSGGQRRLYGAVYSVRKYKQSTDTEAAYAVIIWIDAAVKDKAEIEITSFDDYFELLNLT